MNDSAVLNPKTFSTKMKSKGYMVLAQPMPARYEGMSTAKSDEHLFLVSGQIQVGMGDQIRKLSAGETLIINAGTTYRVKIPPPNGAYYLLAKKPC